MTKHTISFLKEGERIEKIVHRHWIVFVFKLVYLLVLLLSTMIILLVSEKIIWIFGSSLFWWALSLYWLFFLTFILLSWINDELDLFIITNERIIGIEQIGALTRTVTECSLDRVQEVNAETSWVLQTLFGYGHIHIHTASEHSDMIVRFAPHPIDNGRKINTIINEYHKSKSISVEDAIKNAISA
jgi:uncharacterized membrane protein YdbT with pleckstrin-like domain